MPYSVVSTTVYRVAVYHTAVYCTAVYRTAVYRTTVYRITEYRTAVYRTAVYRTAVYRTVGMFHRQLTILYRVFRVKSALPEEQMVKSTTGVVQLSYSVSSLLREQTVPLHVVNHID